MLGQIIKEHLEKQGITQKYVAEKAGISIQTLNAMLNANRKIEAIEYFSICQVLNVSVNYFAELVGPTMKKAV